ncbi:hypothetical protein BSL82_03600 [Tardibacter chloracetimidivorans]|uniref:Uncharacterized protein n=1 Tax=Tardibacter chloracetimidivorans TaxID=1921510 RepID=A0A1L3ZSA0_9SPHN|nr:hypothetical protein [Tardibacter chloracetimidivorans]API58502.1 hypothetical protein BSL82_03600 [Tardibacter chloracetimidivorans]
MEYVVPMYESERGWGAKIDGYAGPFETIDAANVFRNAYNKKRNNKDQAPDYYILALEPVAYKGQECLYRSTVEDDLP